MADDDWFTAPPKRRGNPQSLAKARQTRLANHEKEREEERLARVKEIEKKKRARARKIAAAKQAAADQPFRVSTLNNSETLKPEPKPASEPGEKLNKPPPPKIEAAAPPLSSMELAEQRGRLFRHFMENPWFAHAYLFKKRHGAASSPAHRALVFAIWQKGPRANLEAFRGFGKSTLLEETVVLRCGLRLHHNFVIFGSSERRAVERLDAIKTEIILNELVTGAFGPLKGDTWQETKVVLSNGVAIQAVGRDQSLAGIKFRDWRPDGVLVDDLEDIDELRTDADRQQTWHWFLTSLIPSLDNPLSTWVRVLGTRRGSGSLPERLENAGWPGAKFPIETVDDTGARKATWPAKFPLPKIDELRGLYQGDLLTYEQEFMCRATSERARLFSRSTFRYEERRPSWHAVQVMYDPARTKSQTSATTGKAVWSWVGNRLVVWECGGHFFSPDELVHDIIETARRWKPTEVAVEKTGLNEWLMQPLRHEMLKQGILVPLKGVEAPRGKLDFIAALQPLFRAGEVSFAGDPSQFKSLEDQLLSFPRGRIDAPNALAYARSLRPGAPLFDAFAEHHIARDCRAWDDTPLYLAAHSDGHVVAGVLVQRRRGQLAVLADWVIEGSPGEAAGLLATEVALAHGATTNRENLVYGAGADLFKLPLREERVAATGIRWILPPEHFNEWHNLGLVQAIKRLPAPVAMGAEPHKGRVELALALGRTIQGEPEIQISEEASWTLKAFAGGYARATTREGLPDKTAAANIYRVLMEGLESFCGMTGSLAAEAAGREPDPSLPAQPLAYTKGGVPYRSAIPDRGTPRHG